MRAQNGFLLLLCCELIESVTCVLLQIFAFWGHPQKIVSDNGPPFNSKSYKQFCTFYDIALAYSPPCPPQSNTQAEKNISSKL